MVDDILHNWEASLCCGPTRERKSVSWSPPLEGILKFNVDGVAMGKLGPTSVGGALYGNYS